MLTIDYGATADALYHRRPRGTLRAYLFQQRLEGPDIYQNIPAARISPPMSISPISSTWSAPWTAAPRLQTLAAFLRATIDPPPRPTTLSRTNPGPAAPFSCSTRNAPAVNLTDKPRPGTHPAARNRSVTDRDDHRPGHALHPDDVLFGYRRRGGWIVRRRPWRRRRPRASSAPRRFRCCGCDPLHR